MKVSKHPITFSNLGLSSFIVRIVQKHLSRYLSISRYIKDKINEILADIELPVGIKISYKYLISKKLVFEQVRYLMKFPDLKGQNLPFRIDKVGGRIFINV